MDKSDIKKQLERTQSSTLQFFELPPDDLQKRYAPEKWNVLQILHHLTDSETVLYERLKRIISGPVQVLWTFDQDRWNEGLNYEKFPLDINKDIFKSIRRSVIYLLEQHYDSKKEMTFIHSKVGKRNLGEEFQKIGWHNEHHLNHIRQALKYG
jgi:hypothetical protein